MEMATAVLLLGFFIVVVLCARVSRWPPWTGFTDKTLWDWLQLLLISVAFTTAALLYNASQKAQQQTLETNRLQENILQMYFDRMIPLTLEQRQETQQQGVLLALIRAQTAAVLPRLNGERNGAVLRFLHEAGLLDKSGLKGGDYLNRVNLRGADLEKLNLSQAELQGSDLEGADLKEADLREADLERVNMRWANLREATLHGAALEDANLLGANLQEADLCQARLVDNTNGKALPETAATVKDTNFKRTIVRGTDLRAVDLSGAKNLTQDQLDEACVDENTKLPTTLQRPSADKRQASCRQFSDDELDCEESANDKRRVR